jgi:hypothetical protein
MRYYVEEEKIIKEKHYLDLSDFKSGKYLYREDIPDFKIDNKKFTSKDVFAEVGYNFKYTALFFLLPYMPLVDIILWLIGYDKKDKAIVEEFNKLR